MKVQAKTVITACIHYQPGVLRLCSTD